MKQLQNKYFSIILMAILYFFSISLYASDTKTLLNKLENMQKFQANFVQHTESADTHSNANESTGKLWIQRPNLFRWETQLPEHILIVADGKKVWHYDETLEQVIVQPVNQLQSLPALLLSGEINEIQAAFDVQKLPTQNTDYANFKLNPKQKDSFADNIQLSFYKNKLKKMSFKNGLNQYTEIIFAQQKLNSPHSTNLFEFTVPKGADVLGS